MCWAFSSRVGAVTMNKMGMDPHPLEGLVAKPNDTPGKTLWKTIKKIGSMWWSPQNGDSFPRVNDT